MEFIYHGRKIKLEGFSDNDHIYKMISANEAFYEIDLLEYIKYITGNDKGVCIDVGANIGNHSVFFGTFVGDKVISFEPNPAVLPTLKKNLSNNLKNYTLYECGLGETEAYGKSVMPDSSSTNVGMAQVAVLDEAGDDTFMVRTLDNVFDEWRNENNENIKLIKIDVEGMELDVLKGASKILEEQRPHFFVEALTSVELKKLEDYFSAIGYEWLTHWAYTPVYHFMYKPSIKLKAISKLYKFKYNIKLSYWGLHRKIEKVRRELN
jgi:FkbM family methyltransferase